MCKPTTDEKSIQIGPHDPEMYELIDLINSYTFPADFFLWLSDKTLVPKVIQEDLSNGKFRKIDQFFIENSLVFTCKTEFDLSLLSKDAIQVITQEKPLINHSIPGLEKLTRLPMTKISTELHYTIVAHLCLYDKLVGFSWEIFELQRVIALYEKMNDPLRYWRKK